MIKAIRRLIQKYRCKHENAIFVRNIYGDEINNVSLKKVYRSWWKCNECECFFPKENLVDI